MNISPLLKNVTTCLVTFVRHRESAFRKAILHRHPLFKHYKVIGLDHSKPKTLEPLPVHGTGGRGPDGRIWVHRIGGGQKRVYLQVDFKRIGPKDGSVLTERVYDIVPDQMRSANLAVVASGNSKRYILATENMKPGDLITTSGEIPRMPVKPIEGNAHPLGALPIGTIVHNIEIYPERGGRYCHAAGTSGLITRKVDDRVTIKVPSKREINVSNQCMATVGRVSNVHHNKEHVGSPQMLRWMGYRPRSGWWHRKTGYNGRKIKPIPPMKIFTQPKPRATDIFRFMT